MPDVIQENAKAIVAFLSALLALLFLRLHITGVSENTYVGVATVIVTLLVWWTRNKPKTTDPSQQKDGGPLVNGLPPTDGKDSAS